MDGAVAVLRKFLPWFAAAVFAGAVVLVVRSLREHGLDAVGDALAGIPASHLLAAAGLAAASYLTLTGVDFVALRSTGAALPWPRAALGSFVALSVGHVAGLAVLSSGTLRYRVYSAYGISEGNVARAILFCAATVAVGLLTLAGAGALAGPERTAAFLGLDVGVVVALAALSLLVVLGYLVAAARVRRPLRFRSFEVPLPSGRFALLQLGLGTLNFSLVSGVLYRLLGDSVDVGFLAFASFYAAANAASILSHVPGGLGVLEALVLAVASGPETLGALVAFRVVYYFVPFAIGGLLFLVWSRRSRPATDDADPKVTPSGRHRPPSPSTEPPT
ncbi:MAG: lysylphosphatidylglycerol synthase domain-containing protein [Planctomycetota bacterium JB042]